MHAMEQPTQAQATKALSDPKRLQPGVNRGGKFISVLFLALRFKTVSCMA